MRFDHQTIVVLAFLAFLLVAVVLLAGAVEVITGDLTFTKYAEDLSILGAAAIGALGVVLFKLIGHDDSGGE